LIDLYHMNSCSICDSIFLVSVVRRVHRIATESVRYYFFCFFDIVGVWLNRKSSRSMDRIGFSNRARFYHSNGN